ncbi:MAG: YraN family protein [Gammaproteobacteria bacterium]
MTKLQGRAGEDLACRYLQQQGMRLMVRNYRCRRGEIDLIMLHGDSLVFIEVRYRHRPDYGSAAESIDLRKQQKISRCALHYLQRHPALARYPGRFDVVCIAPGDSGLKVKWIPDAFRA